MSDILENVGESMDNPEETDKIYQNVYKMLSTIWYNLVKCWQIYRNFDKFIEISMNLSKFWELYQNWDKFYQKFDKHLSKFW